MEQTVVSCYEQAETSERLLMHEILQDRNPQTTPPRNRVRLRRSEDRDVAFSRTAANKPTGQLVAVNGMLDGVFAQVIVCPCG